jgi:sRNA-binding regulator protein Hfq
MEQTITNEADFFAALISGGGAAHVYTVNGIKIQGSIVGADEHCIFLRGGVDTRCIATSLIMKNAISTIIPLNKPETKQRFGRSAKEPFPVTTDQV